MAQGWVEQVTDAVTTLVPRNTGSRSGPRPRPLGQAHKVAAGVYTVSTAREPISVDRLVDLHLAARDASPSNRSAYRVTAVEEGHRELRVHVGPHAPSTGLWLWGTGRTAGALERNLVEAWQELTDPGLAERLVAGMLDAVPAVVPSSGGLHGDQARAHHACTTPGVRMVWGPPGTGKTTVLARSIDDLLTRGKRVLLVSATNIAVDNALSAVVRMRRPPPGQLVRVGAPTLTEIAQDDRVALPRLVQARLRSLSEQRDEVGRQLLELAARSELCQLTDLDRRLDGFDLASYLAAQARATRDRRVAALTAGLELARHREHDARQVLDQRRSAWEQAAADVDAIASARHELAAAAALCAESDRLDAVAAAAAGDALSAEQAVRTARRELDEVAGGSRRDRLRNRAERTRLRAVVTARHADVAAAAAAHDEARRLAERHRALSEPRVAAHRQAAAPVTDATVARTQTALDTARIRLDEAEQASRSAGREVEGIEAALREATAKPAATEADRTVVKSADRAGLPQLAAERDRLAQAVAPLLATRQQLEQRYETLLTQIDRARSGAEPAIIEQARLVAATLTRFRLDQTVYRTPYDAVFVDEAAAASLPDVLLAAAKGSQTVVLLGDFRQLGPVRDRLTDAASPHARWLSRDCFELVGITSTADALARVGCVSLRVTRRFGPAVVTLANRIAYGGMLEAPPDGPTQGSDDPAIVLLDTDGLGDLGQVRKPAGDSGRWWLAGSVLARALAEYHRGHGESVGIVTPYRAQALATVEHLDDLGSLGGDPPVEAGTAHTFQGREFDVAVVDLVEDGDATSWAAKASFRSAEPFERDGARLLNVAVTRCRHRVYLVTSGRAVRQARLDSAFGHVAALVTERTVRVVRAADLLGLPAAAATGRGWPDPLHGELWAAFAGQVSAEAVYDEYGYVPALADAVAAATSSVWIWSPWFGARQDKLVPLLSLARDRGVTVVAFVVGDDDWILRNQRAGSPRQDRRLADLDAAVTRLVRVRQMHQKIVVIDRETMFLGSYNTLSGGSRREIMVRYRGRRFADLVLRHERAEELAQPPTCRRHGVHMEAARGPASKGRAWTWVCAAKGCPEQQPLDQATAPPKAARPWRGPTPP